MSPSLPRFSGADVVKKLERAGWKVERQKGSHVMMVKPDYEYTLSIPQHKEIGIGLLKKLLRQANITSEEFRNL
ncbi:YcfA family protein [Nitrospina gracilis 3/211]|uniref:YcfA family protein n=2 Tax=Nitrospina TaxID=35800 RepID=M1YGF1_NITG3|nr:MULTISPECIES: type II toxin-antitoxin system HicA family toxin [Nitrospina]CCQ89541.1 YcfA family protein [Nitrospina gracilis 3/211]